MVTQEKRSVPMGFLYLVGGPSWNLSRQASSLQGCLVGLAVPASPLVGSALYLTKLT